MTTANLVEIRDVSFSFGERILFDSISLSVPRGKVTTIMGPSGCGKSTLLSFMGGRLKPQQGSVEVDGEPVQSLSRGALFRLRRRIGMMFQSNALLTDMNVFDNVAFPVRHNTALDETLIRHLVLFKLNMVGLRGARALMPAELSGGMARRVALARAIALDPPLVMYDEPFTGLDPISKGVIVQLIKEVNDALGMTSVVVTHDLAEGCSIADRVVLLGEGKVVASGTPEALQQSDSAQVRQFMDGLPDGPVRYHYPARELAGDLMRYPDS